MSSRLVSFGTIRYFALYDKRLGAHARRNSRKGVFIMARLTYVGQTANRINVTYADMPAGSQLVFVNDTSGAQTPSPGNALGAGGNGSADIANPSVPGGKYHLLAQSDGQSIAQTVPFYLT
jgi:hypothetical protein